VLGGDRWRASEARRLYADRERANNGFMQRPRYRFRRWEPVVVGLAALGIFALAAWLMAAAKPTAPELPPIADQAIEEGQTLEIDLRPADFQRRHGCLKFDVLGGSPYGVKIDEQTGRLTWLPREEDGPGTHWIGVRASVDGSPHLADQVSFEVTVAEVPRPPQMENVALQLNPAARAVYTTVLAKDLDRPVGNVVYSVEIAPPPAHLPELDGASGQFVWRPTTDEWGQVFRLTFRAAKGKAPHVFSQQQVELQLPERN
jgi:hypothetical protein